MKEKIETIIGSLIGTDNSEPLAKIDIADQFRPEETGDPAAARNLNAAFLIASAGESHPLYHRASDYLRARLERARWNDTARFYLEGVELMYSEMQDGYVIDTAFKEAVDRLYSWVRSTSTRDRRGETVERIREVFFPEGVSLCEDRSGKIRMLREKRRVDITRLNPDPIKNPAREILFTSNVLLTLPPRSKEIDDMHPSRLKDELREVVKENQMYWYDHPIQIGVDIERNEAVYGLRNLDEAVEFEKRRGTVKKDDKLSCVLSVSVTHTGLRTAAKRYLEEEFAKGEPFRNLDIHLFTEVDTSRLIREILTPAVERYTDPSAAGEFAEIIGVDGEYGRHYSFLKAIAPFLRVLVDPEIKGTFKIDLDQVFPQRELVEQTGASAFEHFTTPLWGAEGVDGEGNAVELGMIAGALVNEKDIRGGLFSPDVCFPPDEVKGDECIFLSMLPQALSTEAEMMTRYNDDTPLDGKTRCIQRVHVTGGTCGILVGSLRKYRPFTPVFIGRAEDQAYLLSVLFKDPQKNLRYVHKDGLVMRHDKEAFACEAVKAAYTGKLIGDYVRILLFSHYARALPLPVKEIKETIDPFTGCFVSRIPFSVVYLRFALKAAAYFMDGGAAGSRRGVEFLRMGTQRLSGIIRTLREEPDSLRVRYLKERAAWDTFYDVLDHIEKGIRQGDAFALELRERATRLMEDCNITR